MGLNIDNEKQSFFNKAVVHARPLSDYCSFFRIENSPEKLKTEFENKHILLIGGGASNISVDLLKNGVNAASITNVDPFTSTPSPDGITLDPRDFTETNYVNQFHHALSFWALPMYLKFADIPKFWKKSIVATRPLGTVRALPICIGSILTNASDADCFARNREILAKLTREFPEMSAKIHSRGVYYGATLTMPNEAVKARLNEFCQTEL